VFVHSNIFTGLPYTCDDPFSGPLGPTLKYAPSLTRKLQTCLKKPPGIGKHTLAYFAELVSDEGIKIYMVNTWRKKISKIEILFFWLKIKTEMGWLLFCLATLRSKV